MQHLRLQTGGSGENVALYTSTCVHVTLEFPISSKLELQV